MDRVKGKVQNAVGVARDDLEDKRS